MAEAEVEASVPTGPLTNELGEALAPDDPDAIAQSPPTKAIDAKTYFLVSFHKDKWSEFDDRGVPTKNAKKKKPTKKEKDALETEYLDASKCYQKYLKDVENWEQAKLDAEKALQKSDRLRWGFRQVGEKNAPIEPEEMETIIKLMGWNPLTPKEYKVVKKGLTAIAIEGKIALADLRGYVKDVMPIQLLQERLMCEQLDCIELEELYSPRTWRGKLEEAPPPAKSKSARGSLMSPRGGGSARGNGKKKTLTKDGSSSARRGSTREEPARRGSTREEKPPETSPRTKTSGRKSQSAKK